ncbi:hypothetical protein HMI54_014566 [Coelomomyces lativittatus]|nr:hypothetical protein HMI56_005298 [Coelomomyces lativittatus]KAJ1513985.1 hypothetical protein HMI54_014566 [Coelomomyces lativittatus]KAJ1517432.1 hypothetical protein HMI55_007087 [Coelomomyces lativittatus]
MYSGKLVSDAYIRHTQWIEHYLYYHGGEKAYEDLLKKSKQLPKSFVTEKEILEKHHRFIRNEKDEMDSSWEARLAKKYYDRLFKEYGLCDLSKYKSGKIALRWRTQKEVFSGKGHLVCGNLECFNTEQLNSWELPFGYIENHEKRYALVKVRLCPECSKKLHYQKQKERKRKLRDEEEEENDDKVEKDKVRAMGESTPLSSVSLSKRSTQTSLPTTSSDRPNRWDVNPSVNPPPKSSRRPPEVSKTLNAEKMEDDDERFFRDLFL